MIFQRGGGGDLLGFRTNSHRLRTEYRLEIQNTYLLSIFFFFGPGD